MIDNEHAITQDDIQAVRFCAMALRDLSAKHYDPKDAPKPMGLQIHRTRAERAEAVATKLEKRLRA